MSEQGGAHWLKTVAVSVLTLSVPAAGGLLLRMNDRLTAIETTINENKAERVEQIGDLRRRVDRLEDARVVEYRDRRKGEGR